MSGFTAVELLFTAIVALVMGVVFGVAFSETEVDEPRISEAIETCADRSVNAITKYQFRCADGGVYKYKKAAQ